MGGERRGRKEATWRREEGRERGREVEASVP